MAACGFARLMAQETGQGRNWPEDVMRDAKKSVSLLESPGAAFRLEYDVEWPGKIPLKGHASLREEKPDRWWTKVAFADFAEVKIKGGEQTYAQRNLPFEPKQVSDWLGLMLVEQGLDGFKVRKEKRRIEDGHDVRCMAVEGIDSGNPTREICVDAKTSDVLRRTDESPVAKPLTKVYSDYDFVAGHRYPRKLEVLVDGRAVFSAVATEMKEEPFDAKNLIPPKGAIERRECAGMKLPVLASKPPREFFEALSGLRGKHRSGLWITVLTDGTVGEAHLTQSGGKQLDDAVLNAAKRLKYQPGRCGNEAVVVDFELEIGSSSEM